MSDLEFAPLSVLAEINPSVKPEISADSPVSFIPMTDVSNGGEWLSHQVRQFREVKQGYTAFQDNDILFAKITPCTENGKGAHVIGLVNGVGFGSTEFHVLRPRDPGSARYLYHWSQAELLRTKAASVMVGSAGQQRVPAWFFATFEVPLFSLPEQRRIAEILDAADEAIHAAERLIAKLRRVKAGLLHDLLTCGVDAQGNLRDPVAHPEQFKDSPLGRIPREWEVKTIESIGANKPYAIVDGPFGSNLKSEHYREKGIPVIQSGFVTTGYFEAPSYVFVGEALFRAQIRSSVESGDIVMAKIGAQCGTCAILPENHPLSILAGNCLKISTNQELCRAKFLVELLHYYYDIGQMYLVRTETAQPAISLKNLRQMKAPLPPITEQDQITQILDAHDARIRAEEATLAKLRRVKAGLMDDLLTGRVRV
ncbi:MAG: restriction endonuclease subunit S [Anaerolineales bacterium]|nr:restriction endonuclease subunit S [Anaerolineales bacterium]